MYIRVPAYHALGETVGPFEGTFTGSVEGDAGTKTTVSATFKHRDNAVKGTIVLGSGLKLDFTGPCALEDVDVREIPVDGVWDAGKPDHIEAKAEVQEATTQFNLTSIKINVSIAADLIESGRTMNTVVTLAPAGVPCFAKKLKVQLKR